MRFTPILTAVILAVSEISAVAAGTTLSEGAERVGFEALIANDQSMDFSNRATRSGNLNMTYSAGRADFFAGASLQSGRDHVDGFLSHTTEGNGYLSGNGRFSRLEDTLRYCLSGGAVWQLNADNALGISAGFSTCFKQDVSDNSDYSVHRINEVANSDMLIGHSGGNAFHEINERPSDFSAKLGYSGHLGSCSVGFNTGFFMNQNGSNSAMEETDIDNIRYSVISGKLDKNRTFASKLDLARPLGAYGVGHLGTELTCSYHYSDYFLGGDAPFSQSCQNDINENSLIVWADYSFALFGGLVTAGLSYEHLDFGFSNVADRGSGTDRISDRLFPAVRMTGPAGPFLYTLSYSGRSIRPDFILYNDAVQYGNRYLLQSGNSALTDQIENCIGLSLAWVSWGTFLISGSWSCVDNPIIQTFYKIESSSPFYTEGAIAAIPVNADRSLKKLSVNVGYAINVGDFANISIKNSFFDQWFEYYADSEHLLSFCGKPVFSAEIDGGMSLWNNASLTAGFNFRSKGYFQNVCVENNMYGLKAAFEQRFSSLTLRIEGRDMLRHTYCNTLMDCGELKVRRHFQTDSRRITASIRYNFRFNALPGNSDRMGFLFGPSKTDTKYKPYNFL